MVALVFFWIGISILVVGLFWFLIGLVRTFIIKKSDSEFLQILVGAVILNVGSVVIQFSIPNIN